MKKNANWINLEWRKGKIHSKIKKNILEQIKNEEKQID